MKDDCISTTDVMNLSYLDQSSVDILEGYRKELQLKECLILEFFSTNDRQFLLFLLSTWLYQPYLTSDHKLLLEGMLLESELK